MHFEENSKIAVASSSVISLLYKATASFSTGIREVKTKPEVVLITVPDCSTDRKQSLRLTYLIGIWGIRYDKEYGLIVTNQCTHEGTKHNDGHTAIHVEIGGAKDVVQVD